MIRDLGFPSTIVSSKKRTRRSTPIPSPKASTESLTSTNPSQLFTSHDSSLNSQTTPSSSLGGSIKAPKPLIRDFPSSPPQRYRHDIHVDKLDDQASSQTRDSSLFPSEYTSASQTFFNRQPPTRLPYDGQPDFKRYQNYNEGRPKQ